jgi:heme/copper-type cytochrome/quinol oxidase subunit 2
VNALSSIYDNLCIDASLPNYKTSYDVITASYDNSLSGSGSLIMNVFSFNVNFNFIFSQSLISSLDYTLFSSYLFEVNSLLILPLFETINTIVTSIDVIHC